MQHYGDANRSNVAKRTKTKRLSYQAEGPTVVLTTERMEGIRVDDELRTTNPAVYAAGDVCMPKKFANVAEASAVMAVQNAFGSAGKRYSQLTVPW